MQVGVASITTASPELLLGEMCEALKEALMVKSSACGNRSLKDLESSLESALAAYDG